MASDHNPQRNGLQRDPEVVVTLQMHLGANEAGDWANRRSPDAASPTAWLLERYGPDRSEADTLAIRLHDLRGAVEAMRANAYGRTVARTYSSCADVSYGSPIAYRGLRFVTRVLN